jgi:hypothetical protein
MRFSIDGNIVYVDYAARRVSQSLYTIPNWLPTNAEALFAATLLAGAANGGTEAGIVGIDGTVIQAPLANSTFVSGGEQFPWPNDTATTATPYETVFEVQGLSPVSVTNTSTGVRHGYDGVSGGSLVAIDAASNQTGAVIGTIAAGNATALSGTFRGSAHTGFLEATNALSTQDPMTRDLYLLISQGAGSLVRITDDL